MKNEKGNLNTYELRKIAEALIKKEDKVNEEKVDSLTLDEIHAMVHELKVYQIELEMQNDELRKTQLELERVKARYFDIYDLAPEGYLIVSEKGLILESNLTAAVMLGELRHSLVNKRVSEYIAKEEQDVFYGYRKQLYESLQPLECEMKMLKSDKTEFWGSMKSTVVMEEGMLNCRTVLKDITTRKTAEICLKESEEQLKNNMNDLLESQRIAHLGTWRLNMQTDEVVWSEELYKMYGLDGRLTPPPYSEHSTLFTPESWDVLSSAIEQTKTLGVPYELELESVHSDGTNRWIWTRGEAQKNAKGEITSLWGATQDITVRKISEDKLLYLSTHDHLTGLFNRRYYEQQIKILDKKENLPLSVIMFDVNGLKLVNDSFGHDLGDVLLNKAAETIKKACRDNDIIARIGGDEFILILPKTSARDTVRIANHIRVLTAKEIVSNIELSISYGFDTKDEEEQSIYETVVNAENHMYKHKLFERTSIRSKTIELIMNTLFEKSKPESHHSNRVSHICQVIAEKMELDQNSINQMRVVGLMHDIGKIGIDEKILNKPGGLTDTERIDVERHPEIGWRLLSSTNEFSEIAQFVIHHHEKWDGSGYPNGLKGDAIQLESRIIAVAEAYDAMTTSSSYDKKMTKKEAVKELSRCSGTHFDPKIVDVFLDLVLMDEENI